MAGGMQWWRTNLSPEQNCRDVSKTSAGEGLVAVATVGLRKGFEDLEAQILPK